MKVMNKILIIIEFIIAFFAVTYIWILSLVTLPLSVFGIIKGELSFVIPVAITFLASLGFWGIIQLLIKIVNPNLPISKPNHIKVYLLAGIVALVSGVIYMQAKEFNHLIMFLMPALVTIHFSYLEKGYLFKGS